MTIAHRNVKQLCSAAFRRQHYVAAKNMLLRYADPYDAYRRYLFGWGEYPAEIRLKTPCGTIQLMLYSHHDLLTVNEIFCREDYMADGSQAIVVDFGSNIGISAAYFLSRNTLSFAYLFEPVASNIDRLTYNLNRFETRYELSQVAIALESGVVSFGCEETGRYGGIGRVTPNTIQVETIAANDVIRAVVAKHGHIDVLKVDIETLEREVIENLPLDLAERIRTCYVEYCFSSNPLSRTHEMRQYGSIAQFRLLTHVRDRSRPRQLRHLV